MTLLKEIKEAKEYIQSRSKILPKIALILGSGLGELADDLEIADRISFSDIPHFPGSTVKGHKGQLVLGKLSGKDVVIMQGRIHFYEGHSMQKITFPVRVMRALGAEILLSTSACGGLNSKYELGDIVIMKDHINMMGANPLIGSNEDSLGPRFPDMLKSHDKGLINLAVKAGKDIGLSIKDGVLISVSGPTFETRAEIKMMRIIGGDLVGMSFIPEALVAHHGGMKVLGLAVVTDIPQEHTESVTHEEVMEIANKIKPVFKKLIRQIVQIIS